MSTIRPPSYQALDDEQKRLIITSEPTREPPTKEPLSSTPEDISLSFIRNVLMIIALKLLITVIAVGLTFYISSGSTAPDSSGHNIPLYIALGIFIIIGGVLIYHKNREILRPWNIILAILTVCCASYICCQAVLDVGVSMGSIALFAFLLTFAVVVAILIYTYVPNSDIRDTNKNLKMFIIVGLATTAILTLIFCLTFSRIYVFIIIGSIPAFVHALVLPFLVVILAGEHPEDEGLTGALRLYYLMLVFVLIIVAVCDENRTKRKRRTDAPDVFIFF